jgi:hypothetical protein
MKDIKKVLQALVKLEIPIKEAVGILQSSEIHLMGRDLAIMTRQDIINALEQYIAGKLSRDAFDSWTSMLMANGQVTNETGYHDVILGVLEDIDCALDPGETLTREFALALIETLKAAPFDPNH